MSKTKRQQQLFSIAEVSKMTDFPSGEILFFKWLRANGFLLQNNQPSQSQINRGWMVLTESKIYNQDTPLILPTPRITIRGLAGLQKIIQEQIPECPPCEDK